MHGKSILGIFFRLAFLIMIPVTNLLAADESYLRTLSGQIKKGDTCTVIDDKFMNLPLPEWNLINNISVSNIIGFELRQDTSIFFYNKPFTCTLRVSIKYFSSRDMQAPTEINNVEMVVKYDTASGSFFAVNDKYVFNNGFRVTITIDTLFSPELGKEIPAIFRVKNQIIVKRKYPFTSNVEARLGIIKEKGTNLGAQSEKIANQLVSDDNELLISWDPADFPGSEEFDVEWTFIDKLSGRGNSIIQTYGGTTGPFTMPDNLLAEWMRNDNTRITVAGSSYRIHLPYDDGFIIIRVRGVSYQINTDLRLTTNWQYIDDNDNAACTYINAHEPDLSWQYTASFAEEGKRKEVISYFDATLRNRQSVTINNSDNKAIVAETIYDNMGRPSMSILPAPVVDEATRNNTVVDFDNKLKFYPAVNRNLTSGTPYSFEDITLPGASCNIGADKLSDYDAAGLYYSRSNPYVNVVDYPSYYFTRYVADAQGYPFSVTEYMADNTGRIRKQGGVGRDFQVGTNHETKFFYGKPFPEELFRLFGVEVGNASHYLKNMVVDPNGSISVSYVDASGKTIATALAGKAPGNLDELSSALEPSAARHFTSRLINPADFETNTSTLQKFGSANFLASSTGVFELHYSVNPAALVTTHGPGGTLNFCSNCYYDIIVEVRDDCSELVASSTLVSAFNPNDVQCHVNQPEYSERLEIPVNKIGEYSVTYLLKLNEDVITFQTEYYIDNNTDLKTIQDFFHEEVILADLKGCFTECTTCLEDLGTLSSFTDKMMALLAKLKTEKYENYPAFDINSSAIANWISEVYIELLAHCNSLTESCNLSVCDQKLEQMKLDVRPGGQYALIDYDDQTMLYTYTDRVISVLRFYNDPLKLNISGITFQNANGVTVAISTLSESDFIKAYMNHPEWADEFVKEHIEYCGYLWCIESPHPEGLNSNSDSYSFDEMLNRIDGAEAVSLHYYDLSNPAAIVSNDPFFQGNFGATYSTDITDDLSNFSDIMHIVMTDVNGIVLPGKNILETIDWMLYCKPLDPAALPQDFEDSWKNCSVSSNCRSTSQEWELYRNYYLQLKAKYVQLAKNEWGCPNCFIGNDGFAVEGCTPVDPASSCQDDPLFTYYGNKTRIWGGYVAFHQYLDCMQTSGPPVTEVQSVIDLRDSAIVALDQIVESWITRLKSVRDEEGFSNISDFDIESVIVPELKLIAEKWIEIAPIDEIRPASTLPNGTVSNTGFESFEQVFQTFVDPSDFENGFTHELLDQPYPYDKAPVPNNPVTGQLTSDICSKLQALENIFQTQVGGSVTDFHNWLQTELGSDYQLTETQLQDMITRCANGCRLTEELVKLPGIFAFRPNNPDHPWVTCSRVIDLKNVFESQFPNVVPGQKLYRVLLTNYLNHQLGFSYSYDEYMYFINVKCNENAESILFNLSATPVINFDEFDCVANIIAGVFQRASFEYETYIEIERRKFRNAYISKCLSNSAWADLEGDQTEYHFTLYYYDQAGNLVKTIPPEGVDFLTDEEIEMAEQYYADDPGQCTGTGVPTSENQATIFGGISTDLLNGSGKSLEMWLYSGTTSNSREVRIITPNDNYMIQAAIHGQKLWVEIYTMVHSSNYTQISFSNLAVADLSALPPLQDWTHVVVQSSTNLLTGTLTLYLDGVKLTILSSPPGYPFEWSIEGLPGDYTMPPIEVTNLKHIRTYNRIATDAEVLANYKNYCLSPVGALAVTNNPLIRWGRFNIPAAGTATTTGPATNTEWVNNFIVPDHTLPTNYYYNSLNQVVKQSSPDGGTSEFFYDRLGRLTISQNQEQKTPKIVDVSNPANRFSYTRYDAIGRITEVGEKLGAATINESQARDESLLNAWLGSGSNRQVTYTAYDVQPSWAPTALAGTQTYLRKRVAATALLETASPTTDPSQNRLSASYYSYDINGNVHLLVQENTAMAALETGSGGLKRTKYEYDLVSGKVNKVLYQDGKWDQFYYQYLYDAENRLIKALTTRDNPDFPAEQWNTEATYRYYLHGPLARMELGHHKVQGVDYAYTLQGWLKGVNSQFLDPDMDMSHDGKIDPNNPFKDHARDVFGFALGYFTEDYSPAGSTGADAFALSYTAPTYDQAGLVRSFDTGKDLFNGNIGHATYAIGEIASGSTSGYTYRYDQLNRLTAMRKSDITSGAPDWDNSGILTDYAENISYDANGNILTYERNGDQSVSGIAMDNMTYQYERYEHGRLKTNRLRYVHDEVQGNGYIADIKTQTTLAQAEIQSDFNDSQFGDNYQYDEIGNLISDITEGIDRIQWNVYGKIAKITKGTTTIEYGYDATGNRISKSVNVSGTTTTTFYSRDAQGNVFAVYSHTVANGYKWDEQHMYGSRRLGMLTPGLVYPGTQPYNATGDPVLDGILGKRGYELSNHLGNVMVTISDVKIGVDIGSNGSIDYYEASVVTAGDYYPGGMDMPGRNYSIGNHYRYSFNGKEFDGETMQYDYGFRIYDPRLVKFKSVDPLMKNYPWNTPYSYAENDLIRCIDVDGLEKLVVIRSKSKEGTITSIEIMGIRSRDVKAAVDMVLKFANGTPLKEMDVLIITKQVGKEDVLSYDNLNKDYLNQIKKSPEAEPTVIDNTLEDGTIAQDAYYNGENLRGAQPYSGESHELFYSRTTFRYGTEIVATPIINQTPITANLDIAFEYNREGNDGTEFSNKASATTSIGLFAQRLNSVGLKSINLSISADYKSFSSNVKNHGSVSALINARGETIKREFAKFGIGVNNISPILGAPSVSATSSGTIGVQIGWNLTSFPVRQAFVNGVPGNIQRTGTGTTTRQFGGVAPRQLIRRWNR